MRAERGASLASDVIRKPVLLLRWKASGDEPASVGRLFDSPVKLGDLQVQEIERGSQTDPTERPLDEPFEF